MNRQSKQTAYEWFDRLNPRVRQHDSLPGPERDVPGRDVVCRASFPAGEAEETITCRPVGLVDRTATRTCPARIARIDEHYRDPRQFGFVTNITTKLIERPRMQFPALALLYRDPLPNSLEIFQSNPATGVKSDFYKLLSNTMIEISGEPAFFVTTMNKQSTGGLSTFLLKFPTQPFVASTKAVHFNSGIVSAIAIAGDVNQTEIDTQKALWIERFRLVDFDDGKYIKFTISIDQIGLSTQILPTCTLVATYNERHYFTTIERQDRDSIDTLPRQYALIVSYRAKRPENRLNRLVSLVRFANLGYGPDCELSRKTKLFSHFTISQFLKSYLIRSPFREGVFGHEITCGIESPHGPQQAFCLLGRGLKLGYER
jgi:hypothetical protein